MDNNIPIDRLEEFEEHLQALKDEPETPLDAKLFDDVELQLTRKCTVYFHGQAGK